MQTTLKANRKMLALALAAAVGVGAVPSVVIAKNVGIWTEKEAKESHPTQMPSLGPLVKEVADAVLTISTEAQVENVRGPNPTDPQWEFFRRFGFDFEMPRIPRQQGQGTGFLISRDGFALTNHHVIENASVIKVRVGEERQEYEAEVVGSDPSTDVALIKLKGTRRGGFPVIPLGDSDKLEVGDFVVAIGNPFGLSQSVSMGILSARGRRDIMPSGRQGLYDFLQTDASINPGNSGGPLINLNGEVVGINTAINAAGQGIGFAIPINLVKRLIPELKESGQVSRSWIGVSIRGITPELARGFGLERPRGALVAQVVEGGPAKKAGLQPGDIITRFDGREIEDASQLPLLASFAGVGKNVEIEIVRDGKPRKLSVKLEQLPGDTSAPKSRTQKRDNEQAGKLGLTIDDVTPNLRQQAKLDANVRGAFVLRVFPMSAAAEAGIQQGDVIVQVNGKPVRSAAQFVEVVRKAQRGDVLKVLVRRGDGEVFTPIVKP